MNYKLNALHLSKKYLEKEAELVVDAQANPKVMLKRRVGFLCALDYFSEIFLHRNFVRHYSICVGFANFDPYSYKKYSLASFISSSKNLPTCITRLRNYLWQIQTSDIERVLQYAEQLLTLLEQLQRTLNSFNKINQSRQLLPYCCFCWKRIENSQFYCEEHHPKTETNEYNKANRRLAYALKTELPDEYKKYVIVSKAKNSTASHKFKWTEMFASSTVRLDIELSKNKIFLSNLVDNFDTFHKICGEYYPISSSLLNTLKSVHFDTWQDVVVQIIKEFDSTEGTYWEVEDIETWVKPLKSYNRLTVLLYVIQRFEAYSYIKKIYSSKKSFQLAKKNHVLQNEIVSMAEEQSRTKGKVNRAEIARKLSVTRQHVSKILLKSV